MSLNILIIPDKFKGTLTAFEAAEAMAGGWRKGRPEDRLETLPMSDGGDGFGETLARQERGQLRRIATVDAAGQSITAPWWRLPDSNTAIVESACVVGLARLPEGKYHPFELDSRGLGIVMAELRRQSVKRVLIGLGGSATNDGGFGMATALGWRFLRPDRSPIERWPELTALRTIEAPAEARNDWEVTVAVDVQNRLLGAEGATRIYGPQKGLREDELPVAEACLERMAECLRRLNGRDDARRAGAGAAGGLGFGLFSFFDAQARLGFDVFAELTGLEAKIAWADLVITGEGALDASTMMGKGVGQVANRCRRQGKPCLGLSGVTTVRPSAVSGISRTYSLTPDLAGLDEAMAHSSRLLTHLAERAAREWRP